MDSSFILLSLFLYAYFCFVKKDEYVEKYIRKSSFICKWNFTYMRTLRIRHRLS